MLIEFAVTNFRSFRERQALSMVASRQTTHGDSHSFDSGVAGIDRLLASAVVYGPNASGKTNLLRALQTMQHFVVQSAAANFPLEGQCTPFRLDQDSQSRPTEFEITFLIDGTRYEYGFACTGARFVSEWLIEYANPRGRTLFERTYNAKTEGYDWQFSTYLKGRKAVWQDATRANALFLSTAVQLNATQLAPIANWFANKCSIATAPVGLHPSLNPMLTTQLLLDPKGKAKVLPFLQKADFDISDVTLQRERVNGPLAGPAMRFESGPDGTWAVRASLQHPRMDGGDPVSFDLNDESHGTQVLFHAAGAWLKVLEQGELLLFDELEASLHPLLIRYLVDQFHSPSTNKNRAQLIFTTHNTSLLTMDLFRRDQIWFVERGQKSASHLFPLSDFKPREGEALERGYLRGRYGALPLISELAD